MALTISQAFALPMEGNTPNVLSFGFGNNPVGALDRLADMRSATVISILPAAWVPATGVTGARLTAHMPINGLTKAAKPDWFRSSPTMKSFMPRLIPATIRLCKICRCPKP